MKTIYLLTAALCLLITTNAFAQQDSAAAQKAWMEYMTPGPNHQSMAKADGDWITDMTFWERPGAPPTKATGTCTNKMILGGRYQDSRFTATMMGMPFEGIGTLAYDNSRKVFISSWIDNMSTGMMILEGRWNQDAMALELNGKVKDPVSGKEMNIREVMKWKDDGHQLMEMYRTADGKEFKEMEINFTRK
ncbi:uncharacterized protein DUF1579 [Chitinophaga niastensis]|uniref:Uncharacterized protein DUF1579 n=1 Tax=Chitinophaga niastensis TaxID=536980 RepID=A0A2P8HNY0_CHINA|nr:DUF1579 domain-containing protein [Chitinophaga niastensis]PSL47915.1 uncharacterized protein DUF1579 [Chitinophaga niastensis]